MGKDDDDAVVLDHLERVLSGTLLALAENYRFWDYLKTSPKRSVYLQVADTALQNQTMLRDGKPPDDLTNWRDQVAAGLLECRDVRRYLRRQFLRSDGADLLADKDRAPELGLALAGTIVAMYVSEHGMPNAV